MPRQTRPLTKKMCDKYHDKPNRFVARALHAADPREYPSIERARDAVRFYRGQSGKQSKATAIQRGTLKLPTAVLPPPYLDEWKRVNIDSKKTLLLSDIHVPYHDLLALQTAIDYGKYFKPDTIIINGDMLDYYRASRFPKSKNRPTIVDELTAANQFLRYLRQQFTKQRIIYKFGNHDERYEAYVMEHAPELIGVVDDAWRGILGITEYKIETYTDQEILDVNGLPVLHGHELPKGMTNPVGAARGAFLRTVESCVVGHYHQTSAFTARTAFSGRIIATHSMGCLCQLSPKYARINQWNHGLATVEKSGAGYVLENKRIVDGKVY